MRFARSIVGYSLAHDWPIWKLTRRIRRGAFGLGYHGVTPDEELHDDWVQRLHIPLSRFEAQIEFLASKFEILDISDVQRWNGARPAVHLTFDDGFTNFADTVMPVLQKRGIPASVYVVTGMVGTDRRLPTFIGRAAFAHCQPGTVDLETVRRKYEISDLASRMQAYSEISEVLKTGNAAAAACLLEELRSLIPTDQWSDINNRYSSDAIMSWDDVDRVSRAGVTVGAHTTDHYALGPSQDSEVVSAQIEDSVQTLRERFGRCDWFAYPNGTAESVSAPAQAKLEELGLHGAWTLIPGYVDGRSERYVLPRIPAPSNVRRLQLRANLIH